MGKRLVELIEGLGGERLNFSDVEIRGVTCDSRNVQPGYLFVAISGTKQDGHAFIEDAVRRSCAAIIFESALPSGIQIPALHVTNAREVLAEIASRLYGQPTHKLNVIGVTGTNGKSTTAYLIRSILEAAGERAGLLGTILYHVGARVIPSPMTTPSSEDLQAHFAEMVSAGCKSAVIEVSSHALQQDRVQGVRFAAGVFTNLTRDHLDYHASFDEYREAKAKLFEMLGERAIASVNIDDPVGEEYARRTRARTIRYSRQTATDACAVIEASTLHGTRFRLKLDSEETLVHSKLVGDHNVSNMLAAASVTWAMGYELDHIRAGLENVVTVPGRLEPVEGGQEFGVFVDYAHTDDALRNVLTCLRPLVRGRLLLVFGCGGDRDRGKRPLMGHVAEDLADLSIVTSDNPRSENPLDVIREIAGGIRNKARYLIEPDRRAAIKLAVSLASRDDVVLVAGKGHESVQIFKEGVRPFDDRQVALEVLNETVRHR